VRSYYVYLGIPRTQEDPWECTATIAALIVLLISVFCFDRFPFGGMSLSFTAPYLVLAFAAVFASAGAAVIEMAAGDTTVGSTPKSSSRAMEKPVAVYMILKS
jgi:hypothetical protein